MKLSPKQAMAKRDQEQLLGAVAGGGNARIQNIGKYQSCMVSKLPWWQEEKRASGCVALPIVTADILYIAACHRACRYEADNASARTA